MGRLIRVHKTGDRMQIRGNGRFLEIIVRRLYHPSSREISADIGVVEIGQADERKEIGTFPLTYTDDQNKNTLPLAENLQLSFLDNKCPMIEKGRFLYEGPMSYRIYPKN